LFDPFPVLVEFHPEGLEMFHDGAGRGLPVAGEHDRSGFVIYHDVCLAGGASLEKSGH
jgi:hypothetical protein